MTDYFACWCALPSLHNGDTSCCEHCANNPNRKKSDTKIIMTHIDGYFPEQWINRDYTNYLTDLFRLIVPLFISYQHPFVTPDFKTNYTWSAKPETTYKIRGIV